MIGIKLKITHNELLQVIDYNPETGVFTWKVDISYKMKAGDEAGSRTGKNSNYRKIRIKGKAYQAHILAWFYIHGEWPSKYIDHIDGDGGNNRIDNLRLADARQNGANSALSKANTSGVKGVHFDAREGRWRARVTLNRKHYDKCFRTIEEAETFVRILREELHGEFANHG